MTARSCKSPEQYKTPGGINYFPERLWFFEKAKKQKSENVTREENIYVEEEIVFTGLLQKQSF